MQICQMKPGFIPKHYTLGVRLREKQSNAFDARSYKFFIGAHQLAALRPLELLSNTRFLTPLLFYLVEYSTRI